MALFISASVHTCGGYYVCMYVFERPHVCARNHSFNLVKRFIVLNVTTLKKNPVMFVAKTYILVVGLKT